MRISGWTVGIVGCLLLWSPVGAFAQNHSFQSAVQLAAGQSPVRVDLGLDVPQSGRWYATVGLTWRSYCVETTTHEAETQVTYPRLEVFRNQAIGSTASDPGRLIARNVFDLLSEPVLLDQARVCFELIGLSEVSVPERININVRRQSPFVGSLYLRVAETTLFCPWFYADRNTNSWTLLRNTTNREIRARVIWRAPGGTVLPAASGFAAAYVTVPGNGAVPLEAKTYVGSAGSSGSVEVAHDGPPDGLVSHQATLSVNGVAYYTTPFLSRRPW